MTDVAGLVRFDDRGLVPAVVQSTVDGRVLMVGYMDRTALDATRATGLVHFFSRSRQELWRKGETSGNELHLVDIRVDCDGDTLLVLARPKGPTCHTGRDTCFDDEDADAPTPWSATLGPAVSELWKAIQDRAARRPEGSYTASLVAGGAEGAGRKVVEEALEVVLAAKDLELGAGPADRVVEEAADAVYHLLTLLAAVGVDADAVAAELRRRRR